MECYSVAGLQIILSAVCNKDWYGAYLLSGWDTGPQGGTRDFKWREWLNGAKSQDPKEPLGLPEKPKKIPGPKFNPQKIPCRFCGP